MSNDIERKKLSPHEKRILDAMVELNRWYGPRYFVLNGFTRGVHDRTMAKLKNMGYIEIGIYPHPGHENTWRQDHQWNHVYRKIKDHQTDSPNASMCLIRFR